MANRTRDFPQDGNHGFIDGNHGGINKEGFISTETIIERASYIGTCQA